jgi:hypothetical protein
MCEDWMACDDIMFISNFVSLFRMFYEGLKGHTIR